MCSVISQVLRAWGCALCWRSLGLMCPAAGLTHRQAAALGEIWDTALHFALQFSAVKYSAERDSTVDSSLVQHSVVYIIALPNLGKIIDIFVQ